MTYLLIYFLRFLQIIYCIYTILLLIIIVIIISVFVLFALVLGRIKAGNLIFRVCNFFCRLGFILTAIRYKEIYVSPHNVNRQYIFVANHSSYLDIPTAVCSIHQPVRILGKQEMVNIPIFGIVYKATVITVDRSSVANRAKSLRALTAAIKHGISVFIFPEGTFNETRDPLKEFYDGAFRIALETGTPIKPLLFIDCINRLHWKSIFSLTPGKNRVVYLDEISLDNFKGPHQMHALKEEVQRVMAEGLKKFRNNE